MISEAFRVNVRRDYRALLRAKVTPGVVYDGEEAVFPGWDIASREISDAMSEHAPHLHDYQRFAVSFAVARRRAALFLECGLGKASSGLAWVEHVRRGEPAVICAPMAALHEFENEQRKFFPGMALRIVPAADFDAWLENPEEVALVTHHAFVRPRDLSKVRAFVLDESSILKSGSGVIADNLTRAVRPIADRLALTATPAPNDPTEYGQHAVFLGYMRSDAEFKARFFVRDGKDWRVKGHAKAALPRWLARFALWMRDPAAYGMPCTALPVGEPDVQVVDLEALDHDGPVDILGAPIGKQGMSDRAKIRSDLYAEEERTRQVVRLAQEGPAIIWTNRNPHADALEAALRTAGVRVAQIAGTTPDERRVQIIRDFQAGELDAIVSKVKCIGHGVNTQRAERMIFAGYDESYEAFHQALRRAWRQGRTGDFRAYLLMAPEERATVSALWSKAAQWREDSERQEREFAAALAGDLAAYHQGLTMSVHEDESERLPEVRTEHYWIQHGDSIANMGAIPEMQTIPDESVDLAVFSPPFSSLFTYSSESADMGNCSEQAKEEFGLHLTHFSEGLFRVMKPGRVVCLHLAQLIAFRSRHGRKGLRDFRGDVVKIMEEAGFLYYGEFVIPKNPQAVAIRTKSERLQFAQFRRDSLESSPALNDYVLEFRKPGKQAVPVTPRMSEEEWISVATGVWYDIRETDVLPGSRAVTAAEDERHIAPLQLSVISRVIRLWSNEGEVVFTPFLGIGSEVYQAIKLNNIGWGIELKAEYFRQAHANAEAAVTEAHGSQDDFSSLLEMQEA